MSPTPTIATLVMRLEEDAIAGDWVIPYTDWYESSWHQSVARCATGIACDIYTLRRESP